MIRIDDEADEALVARMGGELSAHNLSASGIHDARELFAAVHDDGGEFIAGVYGWTWGGTCWLERLWVREGERSQGIGSRLLAAVEREARSRGCGQLALTTHSFQAPDFYRRHGFEITGEVADYPAGHAYYLMRRRLASRAAAE